MSLNRTTGLLEGIVLDVERRIEAERTRMIKTYAQAVQATNKQASLSQEQMQIYGQAVGS